jgi:hypothetical protein
LKNKELLCLSVSSLNWMLFWGVKSLIHDVQSPIQTAWHFDCILLH